MFQYSVDLSVDSTMATQYEFLPHCIQRNYDDHMLHISFTFLLRGCWWQPIATMLHYRWCNVGSFNELWYTFGCSLAGVVGSVMSQYSTNVTLKAKLSYFEATVGCGCYYLWSKAAIQWNHSVLECVRGLGGFFFGLSNISIFVLSGQED